jgi:acetyl esterase/lipase
MAGLITFQPFKALYVLISILYELARFPLWVLLYTLPAGRPHPQWTLQQAIRMRVVKLFLKHISAIRVKTPLSLLPGKEGDRFSVVKPQDDWAYKGPAVDAEIKPEAIGGTWTPEALQRSQVDDADVVLHFHGGAFVIGNGRDEDTGFLANTFLKHGRVTHVFTPAYRLSSNPGGRFPAALQDAITAYLHLTEKLQIPASRITISGDSAGGNVALALLRYINEHGKSLGMPWPGCVWLWSPWVNVDAAMDQKSMLKSPQYATDYLGPTFGHWGASTVAVKHSPQDPYLSPLGKPFESKSPIFVQTGRAEVLYEDDCQIAKEYQAEGATVKLLVQPKCPHDIILTGPIIGFAKEAQEAAKQAGEFLRANRFGA